MASNAPTRQQMLKWVDMVSFSAHEANLYLDTHPSDLRCSIFRNIRSLENRHFRTMPPCTDRLPSIWR